MAVTKVTTPETRQLKHLTEGFEKMNNAYEYLLKSIGSNIKASKTTDLAEQAELKAEATLCAIKACSFYIDAHAEIRAFEDQTEEEARSK